jgi:hypothetical protein
MKQSNGLDKELLPGNIPTQPGQPAEAANPSPAGSAEAKQFARRAKKDVGLDNRQLLSVFGGAAIVLVLSAYALIHANQSTGRQPKAAVANGRQAKPMVNGVAEKNGILPTDNATDSGEADRNESMVTPKTIKDTATSHPNQTATGGARPPETLGSVPPFNSGASWEPAPYQPGAPESAPNARAEREEMEKASLVFVRTVSSSQSGRPALAAEPELGLGFPPGARLRARLESAVTTAVETPVIAVIEYNYERNGEIIVPAGSKAVGRLQQADRSGYVGIRFDSLVLPDGSTTAIEGTATDLTMRALKGKVEGRNTGRNVLVRSLSGIGEAAAMLVGRGSLNQPLSEGDMMRERVASNIGQSSDEELQRLSIGEHIVVVLPAGAEIYVVLQQSAKQKLAQPVATAKSLRSLESGSSETAQELKQLLELQRQLNEQSAAKPPSD